MSNQIHRVYTVALDRVESGARVDNYHLQGANVDIPAILVGEDGRGRRMGVLPVEGAAAGDTVLAATIGTARSGRPKLIAAAPVPEDREAPAILVLRTPIGYRGSNSHRGLSPWQVLAWGIIAQGAAGRMGSGEQIIASVRPGDEVIITLSGRLYGAPAEYTIRYDGRRVTALPAEEADLIEG